MAPESELDFTELDGRLRLGQMDRAGALVRAHLPPRRVLDEKLPDRWEALRREPLSSVTRISQTASLFEVLAYLGRNVEAGDWLQPWTNKEGFVVFPEALPASALPARVRLQAVERSYAARKFSVSADMAREIMQQCERQNDSWGAGEAAYYLAKSYMRLHQVDDVYRSCERALENFTQSTDIDPLAVRWRVGLTLLVSGFAGWQAGHKTALTKLLAARSSIAGCGDSLAKAHVEHSIGCVYRSMNDFDAFDKAHAAFTLARGIYETVGNPIHLSRVHTNIGRTYFDEGHWQKAEEHLNLALSQTDGIQDDQTKNRQQAEALVYLSWLRTLGQPCDLTQAKNFATTALTRARGAKLMTIEASLALGGSLQAAGLMKQASRCFEEALRDAINIRLAKPVAHAHLCLAEYFLCPDAADFVKAMAHWRKAEQALDGVSSRYLRQKATRIRDTIEDRSNVWIVSKDRVFDRQERGNKFKRFRESLEQWVVARVEEEEHLSLTERAGILGVTPSAYLQKKKARGLSKPPSE